MVNGVAALHAKFAAIPEVIRDEVIKAIEKIATEMVREMRAIAPKDTGALAISINWTWGDAPKGSVKIASFKSKEYGRIGATIYAGTRDKSLGDLDAFYARFQEFGTQIKISAGIACDLLAAG